MCGGNPAKDWAVIGLPGDADAGAGAVKPQTVQRTLEGTFQNMSERELGIPVRTPVGTIWGLPSVFRQATRYCPITQNAAGAATGNSSVCKTGYQ